jgi:hypothetical protein
MQIPTLTTSDFDQSPIGKKDPNRYLIIGFDTEYQRYVDVEYKRLENEVLSYQFSCAVVDRDPNTTGETWSGIILPQGPTIDDRLTLLDFIVQALKAGTAAHPTLKIPKSIYLVAHFTRADVPGFRDFKDAESRANLQLQNIRNLFMNVANDIELNVELDDEDGHVTLKVKIRDTLSLAPGGARGLAAIGDILGFEKIKVGSTPSDELAIKQNMKAFMQRDGELFRAYAIRDAEICAEYALRMIRLYQEKTGKFRMPVTLTSIGVDMITKYWRDQGISPLEIVGKEKVSQKYWSKRNARYQTLQKTVPLKQLFWHEDFFTECYHGGRNEQFWFGPAFEGVWYDYDLSSAYPSAMALIGRPDWQKLHVIRDTEELLNKYIAADLAFANVEFEFPEHVRFPVLPVRTENGLIFPRTGNCSTHISEILLAQSLGAKISLIEGRYIPSARHGNWAQGIDRPKRPFEGFTKYCIDERSKHPKKTLENLFWKELVNSTYGKTAQGLRERRVYDLRDMETKRLEPSKITNPVYASFITAFCRGVLGEIMNRLPADVAIFSVTTDGFLTTATDEQMREAARGTLSKYYMSSRQKLTGDESVYEIKHIIRQPLGWRTRAQATLVESQFPDWDGTGITPKDDERLVLAKGGIRLPDRVSKAGENTQIVDLFFNRTPSDKLSMTLGVGIREMYEQGIDFVDKELERSLSMEFDWKRKPHAVGEAQGITSSGLKYHHLFFSTSPWDSVEQFNKIREIWEQYNQTQRHCLKSKSDYDLFASFVESQLSAEGAVGAYLRKENGDLKRLRQQLIIAWSLRKAGTHTLKPHAFKRTKIFPAYRLKAKELADLLNDDAGIPCSKTDVDNAKKKKVFTPNQVPNTEATRVKLGLIKRHLFPELEIDQFLSGRATFTLDSVSVDQCPLANQMLKQD